MQRDRGAFEPLQAIAQGVGGGRVELAAVGNRVHARSVAAVLGEEAPVVRLVEIEDDAAGLAVRAGGVDRRQTRRGAITQRSAVIAKRWMMLAASAEPGARISARAAASGTDRPSRLQRARGRRPAARGPGQAPGTCSPTSRGTRRRCRGCTCRRSNPPRAPRTRGARSARPRAMTERRGDSPPPRKVGRRGRARDGAGFVCEAAAQPGSPLGHPHQQAM